MESERIKILQARRWTVYDYVASLTIQGDWIHIIYTWNNDQEEHVSYFIFTLAGMHKKEGLYQSMCTPVDPHLWTLTHLASGTLYVG